MHILWTLLLTTTSLVSALQDQDRGTFHNPSARSRLRFRYWVSDASADLDVVRKDIADTADVGAGGVELLGYYNYGDVSFPGIPVAVDWTKYGWGTPAWRKLQDTALQVTKDNDLIIDLALGPNQGAGVPAPYDSEGLQWVLQPFNTSVPIGGHFDEVLPGWGTGPLVSASTGLVVKTTNTSSTVTYTLKAQSLEDWTSHVSPDGRLNVTLPSNATGDHYVVFAYYLVHTGYREQQSSDLIINTTAQSPIVDYTQNGSWAVDHFSSKGAQTVADFWREHLLDGGNSAQLIEEVGEYVWEDSQEFPSNLLWTANAPQAFSAQHGYSIGKFLPILMHGNGGSVGSLLSNAPARPIFVTDEWDGGKSHVTDYQQTMTTLNQEYLDGLTAFAHSLGVQSSTQVGYNLPIDMLANIPHVDAPETETLGFNHNIDAYRQFVGPAVLAGRNIISSEAGAVMLEAFQQTIPELLWDLKRSLAGGVNAHVLHGLAYSGYYQNTSWPGFVPFFYIYSDIYNDRQPGWEQYREAFDYMARLQYAMQTGTPKVDLAFWSKSTDYGAVTTKYGPDDLERAGYTYEYISPDNFALPQAYVEGCYLAPTQQAFQALIIQGNESLTTEGVNKLAKWAHQSLPIVFLNGIPSNFSGTASDAEVHRAKSILSRVTELPNVHVTRHGLADTLSTLGIQPRTSISSHSNDAAAWYTRWRETESETIIYIYHDDTGGSNPALSTKTLTFAQTGTPLVYDAWTGAQTLVRQYDQNETHTSIDISLVGNQTTIIVFKNGHEIEPHQQASPYSPNAPTPSLHLAKWTLTIESWSAPKDLWAINGTVKQNTTHTLNTTTLLPWNKLQLSQNLTYTSGRGFYSTTFHLPPNATGAVLRLTRPIIHTAQVYINGHKTPPLDVTAPKADLTPFLREGENEVQIVVTTPLGNAIIPVLDRVVTAGAPIRTIAEIVGGAGGLISVREYGLVGEVVVDVY